MLYIYFNRFKSLAYPFFFTLCTSTSAYFSNTFVLCLGLWCMFLSLTTMLVILTVLFHFHVISNIQNAISSNYLYTLRGTQHLTTEVLESKLLPV